jgi:hypothetical protein
MLTCTEPTFEGLCKLYNTGHPSLGLFSTEGGQFIGGHGMSEDHRLKTASGLSDLWDGKPIRRVRAGDGASVLPGRRLALHLMVQPNVAAILLGDELLAGQGLLSRMLVTMPDSAIGARLSHNEHLGTDRALKRYGARLLHILEAPPVLAPGKVNELDPRQLPFAAKAREQLLAFGDYVEKAMRSGEALEPVRGFANKLAEHAARLAGVLAVVERGVDVAEIELRELEAGIRLAEHYQAEALRLHEASRVSEGLQLAQRLLDWLLRHWQNSAISLPDIYQRGPAAIRDQATARKCVGILTDHNWLIRIPDGSVIDNVPRREAWRIVRGGQGHAVPEIQRHVEK